MRRRWVQELLDWLAVVLIVLFVTGVLLALALMLGWDPNFGGDEAIAPRLVN